MPSGGKVKKGLGPSNLVIEKEGKKNAAREVIEANLAKNEKIQIWSCENVTVKIPSKCHAVSIQGCTDVTLEVAEVLSMVEVTRCKKVTIKLTSESSPARTVQIDNSDGVIVDCTSVKNVAALKEVQIIAAKSSEMNFQFMHNGTFTERVIPEQFQYSLDLDGEPKMVAKVSEGYSS